MIIIFSVEKSAQSQLSHSKSLGIEPFEEIKKFIYILTCKILFLSLTDFCIFGASS